MTITALPTTPLETQSRTDFNANVAAFLGALPTFITEMNADSAIVAANAAVANAVKWVSGTTYTNGYVVWSPTSYLTYRRKGAGGGTTDPVSDSTNWQDITTRAKIVYAARTSNTILAASDHGNYIDCTTASFTQTFTAAATLAAGWWCILGNSSSTTLTLDPNASELIDGLTTYPMYAGEVRLIQCTGTAFNSVILKGFYQQFTSTTTFTKPPGYKAFGVRAWGGGMSGQRTNSAGTASKGGAGGGYAEFFVAANLVGASHTITIGAGGAAVTTVADCNTGASSFFMPTMGATGGGSKVTNGGGGNPDTVSAAPVGFEGGSSTATPGKSMYGGSASSSDGSAVSASSHFGGAAGGSLSAAAVVRAPGISIFGGSGGAASSASNGVAGSVPGGGGGATQTGTQSGAGGDGRVDVWGV